MTGTLISEAAQWLKAGEIVAIPTETVYGLAANALEEDAVLKIFQAKGRPTFNPLIVHVKSVEAFTQYARDIPAKALILAERFCPGPITFIFRKKDIIPDLVTSGQDSVALRVPAHPMALDLLNMLDFPLAAPSANPFGYVSPTTAKHVEDQLGDKVKYILDGGQASVGVESTIISFINKEPELLRYGAISLEQVEALIGKVYISDHMDSDRPLAPGMLKSHYATRIPLYLGDIKELMKTSVQEETAILNFNLEKKEYPGTTQRVLSESGDLEEVAKNLFLLMRELDCLKGVKKILAEEVPNKGLGLAINDRLKRASVNI